jgi:hypothetical protein
MLKGYADLLRQIREDHEKRDSGSLFNTFIRKFADNTIFI